MILISVYGIVRKIAIGNTQCGPIFLALLMMEPITDMHGIKL